MSNNLGNKQIMAKNILKYMELNDKSRQDICNALGIKYTTLTDWIKAKTYPRIDKIEMMANYFGISKADLVEDNASDSDAGYYLNPETAKVAQEIFENPELHGLFNVARTADPEDLLALQQMALALKRKSRGYDENDPA